jgi:hypothetical protein
MEKNFKELFDKHEPMPLWKETPVVIGFLLLSFAVGYKVGKN